MWVGRPGERCQISIYLIYVLHGMLGLLLDVYYCENTIKNYFLEVWECSRALADEPV